jgi:hypothetical protein
VDDDVLATAVEPDEAEPIVLGVMAATSLSFDISRFFTGSPTDKAIWMLLGGVVVSVAGVVGLLRG